jgi:hypothetical protein
MFSLESFIYYQEQFIRMKGSYDVVPIVLNLLLLSLFFIATSNTKILATLLNSQRNQNIAINSNWAPK